MTHKENQSSDSDMSEKMAVIEEGFDPEDYEDQ